MEPNTRYIRIFTRNEGVLVVYNLCQRQKIIQGFRGRQHLAWVTEASVIETAGRYYRGGDAPNTYKLLKYCPSHTITREQFESAVKLALATENSDRDAGK